jgi:membrane-bound metal-dependent hydrolase YbcI (DUF457 family)
MLWLASGVAALCSTRLPDTLEIVLPTGIGPRRSLIPHRTITHWGAGWAAALYVALTQVDGLPAAAFVGACVGAFVHLLGDAPNPMGVPWVVPWQRVRFGARGLWRSGEHEFLLVAGFTGLGLLAGYMTKIVDI